MADTPYTKGFKAGLAWQLEANIKKLQELRILCTDENSCWLGTEYSCHCPETIALIKGSQDGPE